MTWFCCEEQAQSTSGEGSLQEPAVELLQGIAECLSYLLLMQHDDLVFCGVDIHIHLVSW